MTKIKENKLKFKRNKISNTSLNSITFSNGDVIIKEIIYGTIANFTPTTLTGRKRLQDWKRIIAMQIKSKRKIVYDPQYSYAVTIGMKFHTPTHGEQNLDLDNYSKPVIDAIAAGLFCDENEDLSKLTTYNQFNDSNFRHLYFERMHDAKEKDEECVTIIVSRKTN
jgi:Holliday junction resolvase RusA-like endonuclease